MKKSIITNVLLIIAISIALSLLVSVIVEIIIIPKENPRLLIVIASSVLSITMSILSLVMMYSYKINKSINK